MVSSVVVFPLRRQRRLVSGIAHVLQSKQAQDATLFWRETAKDLLRHLTESGVAVQVAEEEVRNLLYAVLSEIEADATKVHA